MRVALKAGSALNCMYTNAVAVEHGILHALYFGAETKGSIEEVSAGGLYAEIRWAVGGIMSNW